MKNKIFIITIIVISIFLVGCSKEHGTKDLRVTVKSYTNDSFAWYSSIEDENILEYDKVEVEERDDLLQEVIENYYFKGKKEGKTKLIMNYGNISTEKIRKTITYEVIVLKDLNIKAQKINEEDFTTIEDIINDEPVVVDPNF